MKRSFCYILILLSISVLCVQDVRAQDYTRWGLPEGALARLGKGSSGGGDPAVVWSPDGTSLAVASSIGIWLYDADTGAEVALLTGHTSDVRSVAFSPDGKTLASGSARFDNTVRLWDVQTGEEGITLTGHTYSVSSVAFSPDGITLASGSEWSENTIRLWDVQTGEERITLTGHTSHVLSVVFSPDGKTLASGSGDKTIRLWDVQTGEERFILTGHTWQVLSVAFSPDGNTLASGSFDQTIRLWDVQTGEERTTLTGHTWQVLSVAFSPDGKTLASGSGDATIRLWDVQTGEERTTRTGHTSDVLSVAFSPDGKTLSSGSQDATILIWDTSAWAGNAGTTDTGTPKEVPVDRPDELVGTWEAVMSGDDADTTRVRKFHADGRFVIGEKTTSHASFKQTLITELGADPGRVRFLADSLAARESRFHDALIADKQVFATEIKGVWGVEGNVILALADSFSMSLNGLQGNDVFEFYEEIVPLVVPSENAGLIQLFLLGIALIQETFNAIIEAREVFPIGLYSFENDNLVLVLDEDPVHYSRVSETPTPDFDGDGTVGFSDFVQFASRFGLSQSDAGYDARFDLDGDGAVGFSDFLIFAASFGQGA